MDEQLYYYILFINDRTVGEEVVLFRSKVSALEARDTYVDERLRYSWQQKPVGAPDYVSGGRYKYIGEWVGGDACVYRVKVKD